MSKSPSTASFRDQDKLQSLMKKRAGGVLHTGEVTRDYGDEYEGGDAWAGSGTSIFDPVLCELAYRWFCPPGGTVLDPFAGGSVRGIVASKLGRRYVGIDLSERQLVANRAQAAVICANDPLPPTWIHGNSLDIETLAAGVEADFIMSCPPYLSLEVYSDDERDLSTMSNNKFNEMHAAIIAATCRMLKPNRFAFYVVGDVRDADGNYECFPENTVMAFRAAGMHKYNSAILETSIGSLPIRSGKIFNAGRKLGKAHQDVFVFLKGDAKKATEALGAID